MLAGAVIMLIGAPFGYYGTLQPHGAVIAAVSLWAVLYVGSRTIGKDIDRREAAALPAGAVAVS